MANYVISKVRVSKPIIQESKDEITSIARSRLEEIFETMCNDLTSNPSEVWNEIDEEAQCWDGVCPTCWIDEESGFRQSKDQLIFSVISKYYFPLAHLFEIFRDRYYPLCIDVIFADEIADYEIDYAEYDYGKSFEEISETNDILNNIGCVGVMRLSQNIDIESSDEDDICYEMHWKFFFPEDVNEKLKIKTTAWAGCTFSDCINTDGLLVEGENGILTMEKLLKNYVLENNVEDILSEELTEINKSK